jgi:hypothetical protein
VAPGWLTALAWIYVLACLGIGLFMIVDMQLRGRHQSMKVMEWVWPITALYLGPFALWAYVAHGRRYSPAWRDEHPDAGDGPLWMRVGISTSHCGAGCSLGDIVAEWIVFAFALTLLGESIYASYGLDYAFAFSLGVVFQYFAISQMGKASLGEVARRTAKADLLSLSAFEIGLFAWMGLAYFVLFTNPHLTPHDIVFWFMMQIGMIIGFFTSYPANKWLISHDIKEAM